MAASVLIVDDHPTFRSFARRLLEAAGYSVVGEAGDGGAALLEARRLHPEVVLLDIQLPDSDGVEIARLMSGDADPPAVVLVSSRDAAEYGTRLAACGARGFIAKADLSGPALRALLAGA